VLDVRTGPRGDGDDPRALGEQSIEHCVGLVGESHAPRENRLGGALGDDDSLLGGTSREHRGHLALVVERKGADSLEARDLGHDVASGAALLGGRDPQPQGLIEGIATDGLAVRDRRLVTDQSQHEGPVVGPADRVE
jgi:hypothetical protein